MSDRTSASRKRVAKAAKPKKAKKAAKAPAKKTTKK